MKKTGKWKWDGNGLPQYEYIGGYPVKAVNKNGKDAMLPENPCFLLGNHRMTVFAHVSGSYEWITGERGWARLNHKDKNTGWSKSALKIKEAGSESGENTYVLTADNWVGNTQEELISAEQTYGVGYACYQHKCPREIRVTRVLSAAPSLQCGEGNASLLLEAAVENQGTTPKEVTYQEQLLVNYCMLTYQNAAEECSGECVVYDNEIHLNEQEKIIRADISPRTAQLFLLPEKLEEYASYDGFPPVLFMKALETDGIQSQAACIREGKQNILEHSFHMVLAPGETKNFKLIIGVSFDKDPQAVTEQIADLLQTMKCAVLMKDSQTEGAQTEEAQTEGIHTEGIFAQLWKKVLPEFTDEKDEALRQEMVWNAYVLECMATYHAYFKETFIPQGSVYAYRLGQNASNRDHLQHLLPMIYLNPKLAKSCIRFAMKHTRRDGEICREDIGYGYCEPSVYMESDEQIYMFQAVGEYLRVTKDYGFLEEQISYYPVEDGKEDTVLRMLTKHFIYLRDTVGKGRHGLVRMLNSDWSDSFFHRNSPNVHWADAESHLNTTMVLAVLPNLIQELKNAGEQLYTENLRNLLIEAMEHYYDSTLVAFLKDMEGRTYAPRCYISNTEESKYKFGMDALCLEAQTFLLQMKDFPMERKEKLLEEIKSKVLDMESIGARTRETPIWDSNGHGEDGGIWFAHQGALMTGMAEVDLEEAKKLMKKLTFHHYAEVYPEYWVGQWTFADSLESTLSEREGLYYFWTTEAFWPFCAHAHAWMLYCYLRLREQEAACLKDCIKMKGIKENEKE